MLPEPLLKIACETGVPSRWIGETMQHINVLHNRPPCLLRRSSRFGCEGRALKLRATPFARMRLRFENISLSKEGWPATRSSQQSEIKESPYAKAAGDTLRSHETYGLKIFRFRISR